MFRRQFIVWSIVVTAAASAWADEALVRNGDLSEPSGGGDVEHWELVTPLTGERVPNENGGYSLSLDAEDGSDSATWLQRDLPLKPGGHYSFTYRAKAEPGQQYRGYVEYWNSERTSAYAQGAEWRTGTGEWQENKVRLTYQEGMTPPYIALNVKAPGKVLFADISIEDLDAQAKADLNKSLALEKWNLASRAKKLESSEGDTIELRSDTADEPSFATLSGVPLFLGQRYRLSYQIRSDPGTASSTGFQYFRVYAASVLGQPLEGGEWQDCYEAWGTRFLEFTVRGDGGAPMMFVAELKSPGRLLMRNFTLEPVEEEKQLPFSVDFTHPPYRQTLYEGDTSISGVVSLKGGEVSDISVVLEQDGKVVGRSTLQPHGGKDDLTFEFSASKLTKGEAQLTVQANTKNGSIGHERFSFLKVGDSKPAVIIDKNLALRYDGKPFFPIALWSIPNNHRQMHDLHKAGFNAIVGVPRKSLLDTADRYDIKVIGDLERSGLVARDSSSNVLQELEPKLKEVVERYKNHPALLAWYIADEPLWTGRALPPLRWTYSQLRRLDPYHPVWINEAPRNTIEALSKYATASDIFGVDIYPVPQGGSHSELDDRSLSSVGKYTDRFHQTVAGRKPIWMVLQGFAWLNLHDPKVDGIYPTWEESRFMAFNAIVHGAHGLVYWGTQFVNEPIFWDFLMRVARQVADISAVLVEPSVLQDQSLKAKDPAIAILQKRHGGEDYFIVVNESANPVEAELKAGSSLSRLYVHFEARSIDKKDGRFQDHFKPWDVHVYSTSEKLPPPLLETREGLPESGESYQDEARKRKVHTIFESTADWIWAGETKPKSKAFLRRAFEVRADLRKATLWITGDDFYHAYLNGKKVGSDQGDGPLPDERGGWMTLEGYDVTGSLTPGSNYVAVEVENAGQTPAGLLADLRLEYADGSTETVVSDAKWKGLDSARDRWNEPGFDDGSWASVKVIGPYGSSPWQKNLQMSFVPNP